MLKRAWVFVIVAIFCSGCSEQLGPPNYKEIDAAMGPIELQAKDAGMAPSCGLRSTAWSDRAWMELQEEVNNIVNIYGGDDKKNLAISLHQNILLPYGFGLTALPSIDQQWKSFPVQMTKAHSEIKNICAALANEPEIRELDAKIGETP